MNLEIDKERRKFLHECDMVVKIPSYWFIRGDEFVSECNLLPMPVYLYLGCKNDCNEEIIEIKANDILFDSHQRSITMENMRSITEDDAYPMPKRAELFDLYFLDYIDKRKLSLDRKIDFPRFKNIEGIYDAIRKLKKSKIKIWSEIPKIDLLRSEYIYTALSVLVTCKRHKLSPEDFNTLIKEFNDEVLECSKSYVPFGNVNLQQQIMKEIFTLAWILSYRCNGSIGMSSLLRGVWQELPYCITNIEYKIPPSDVFRDRSYLDILSTNKESDENRRIGYVKYVLETIYNHNIHIKVAYESPRPIVDVLIVRIKNAKQLLLGPVLNSLFTDSVPGFEIRKESECRDSYTPSGKEIPFISEPEIQACFSNPFLRITGKWEVVHKIEQLLEKQQDNCIIYSSCSMGWEMEGVRLLHPSEYKADPKEISEKIEVLDGEKKQNEYFAEFTETHVRIGRHAKSGLGAIFEGKLSQQPFQLFEYFFIKENRCVHWVEAIKIFKQWQKVRKTICNLKENFRNVVSDLKTEFREQNITIDIESQKNGWWKLITKFDSNIHSAQESIRAIQRGDDREFDTNKIKQKLLKAVTYYSRSYDAATLILASKDKIKFDDKVINNLTKLVLRRKTALEKQIKPTLEYYIKNEKRINWRSDAERQEFIEETQAMLFDINHEILKFNQCLQGLMVTHDQEYDEIQRFIQEEDYDKLFKTVTIHKLIGKIVAELLKRQSNESYGLIWQWFASYEKSVIEQYVEAWLCEAIEKNKRNIDFVIAWNKNILVNYFFKITINEIREVIYMDTLQLPHKAIKDRANAIKWIQEIIKENNGTRPPDYSLRILLCEKTKRPAVYSDYLFSLVNRGTELPIQEEILGEKTHDSQQHEQ